MRLPSELCRESALLLQRRHREHLLPGETFLVEGDMSASEVELDLRLEAPGGHERTEMTLVVKVPEGAGDADEALALALDAGDALLAEWLETGREERFPIDFLDYVYEGRPVAVRVRRRRPSVEAQADRLLRESGWDGGPED